MLKISKALSAEKVGTYYEKEYTNRGEAYYSQEGQLRGEWHGKLAETFGLSGSVGKAEFDRLAIGQDPNTGRQLVEHRDTIKTKRGEEVGHRAAWDLTFGAPKTVSLTALVGGDERATEAHRAAVRTALDATEKYVQARMGGDRVPETTGKWVAAVFEHDTARPVNGYPAPHLHTHVVMFNMTMADQVRSLDTRELFRVQSMSTAIYQAELASRLKGLGYELEPGKNFSVEIKGYTREYRDAASARSFQIADQMQEKGISGAESAERIAHQTREAKQIWSAEELKSAHRIEAEKYGNQPDQVVSAARAKNVTRGIESEQTRQLSSEAITYAKHRLSERSAVFDEYEMIRDSLRHSIGQLRLADVERAFGHRLQDDKREFIPVNHHRVNAPGQRFTTPEMVRMERASIETVRAGVGGYRPIAPELARQQFRTQYESELNGDQMRLVWNVLQSRDRIIGIQGGAGTGKTTALRPLRELAEANGYETRGLAPTSGAARDLSDAGLQSETLQAHLMRSSGDVTQPCLYFLDESSLSSTKQIHTFLTRLRQEDRVLLIGDIRQHQAVEAGRIFEELQDAGMATYQLDKIVRQKNEELKTVVEHLAAGNISAGLKMLDDQGRISQAEDRNKRFEAIAVRYAESPAGTLVVSPDNESRKEINAAIRKTLRAAGGLDAESQSVFVLANRQDLTGVDRQRASAYHTGDVIRYGRANQTVGVSRGEYATVIDIDHERNTVTVERQRDGVQITYNPKRLSGVQLYEQEERQFAVGERIQFTNPWKEKEIGNRDIGTITRLDEEGHVQVKLDKSGRSISWKLKDMRHVDYGYAMTSYSAQGATVDRVLVQIDTQDSRTRSLVDKTLAYVALSRPRYDIQIFTDSREALTPALSREVKKPKALSPEEIQQYRQPSEQTPQQQLHYAIA